MEKIGLFDLIDKFSSVASGKNEFNKKPPPPSPPKKDGDEFQLFDPQILPPKHYLMNSKMVEFCNKHDNLVKSIKNK